MADDLRAGLDQPFLEARQRPVFDRLGRRQGAQEVAEIIGEGMKLKADGVEAGGRKPSWPLIGVWNGDSPMFKSMKNFAYDDSGVTAIEYALITSLIAVFVITALQTVGTKISTVFTEVGNALK
jgi:pilus assembly protein Flp/PilA